MRKILFLFLLPITQLYGQPANKSVPLPSKVTEAELWADSVYESLNMDQRLGQLFMLAAYSGGANYNRDHITNMIRKYQIGGLIFMQGNAESQAELTNEYNSLSKIPLMIAMDAEWGLGMRLTGIQDLPRQIMVGASGDEKYAYKLGKCIAEQCKRMGVHVNFGPVVDVNNNPDNPVINFRSYGEDPDKVSSYGVAYMKGLQDMGVLACAKHFPGHGNTSIDSHQDLPELKQTLSELNQVELPPFQALIDKGVGSMMIAHLSVPSIDASKTPTTLSEKVVTGLLKNKMKFKGLIFTDALDMKGVAKYYKPGEVDLKAFQAGNDVLLFSQDVGTAVKLIKNAIAEGKLDEDRVQESVKKILKAKYLFGLNKRPIIEKQNATASLNSQVKSLREDIARASVTMLTDKNGTLKKMIEEKGKRKILITIGMDSTNTFSNSMVQKGYRHSTDIYSALSQVRDADYAVVSIHGLNSYPKNNFGMDEVKLNMLKRLLIFRNTTIIVFGNPYFAKNLCDAQSLMVAYDDQPETQKVVAEVFDGKYFPKGILPVSVCSSFPAGTGFYKEATSYQGGDSEPLMNNTEEDREIETSAINPLAGIKQPVLVECCVSPKVFNADMAKLNRIDNFLNDCVNKNAFPGCRVLVAKDGKVFYDKSFGTMDENASNRVRENTIYDLASVTKVLSTTLAVMKLVENGKINLNATLGDYLPMTRGSDKQFLKIRDVLLHQAGLPAWIPFYKETLDSNKQQKPGIYSTRGSAPYNVQIADRMYMHKGYIDTIWDRILKAPLGGRSYVYSDLDFIFLQKVIERVTGTDLDIYVEREFYKPLGLKNTGYNPLKRGKKLSQIAPSELDNYWRYQDVHGYVHDMAAAMMGGVAGHAGLFSTATDVSILLQMLLNGGIYNGKRYLKESTIKQFTSYGTSSTRRGLGWDKPERVKGKSSPVTKHASTETFGHQGFTGTCVWADPMYNIQYIFLSNRTYPSADNSKINDWNVRTEVMRLAYEALGLGK